MMKGENLSLSFYSPVVRPHSAYIQFYAGQRRKQRGAREMLFYLPAVPTQAGHACTLSQC